jgi:hypothetical protein
MNNKQIQLLKDSIIENLQANEQIDTKTNKMNLYDYLCDVVLVFKETAEKMNDKNSIDLINNVSEFMLENEIERDNKILNKLGPIAQDPPEEQF